MSSSSRVLNLTLTTLYAILHVASGFSVLEAEGRESAAPQQVHFYSINLRNIIRWTPGKGATRDTTYTVEYAIYGDAEEVTDSGQVVWRPVEKCSAITTTECDISEQTNEIEEDYYARVRANGAQVPSSWIETEGRFHPLMDTILGPPEVETRITDNNYINIRMKGPFMLRMTEKKLQRKSLHKIIPFLVYNVTVLNSQTKHMDEHYPVENDSLLIGPFEYEMEYCFIVEVLSRPLPLRSIPSSWKCITTPKDPFTQMILVLLLGVAIPTALCMFILASIGGFAYFYICIHKQKLPKSTDLVHIDKKPQMFQPENLTIINVNLNPSNLSPGESKHQKDQIEELKSPLNYFQQNVREIRNPTPALLSLDNKAAAFYARQNISPEQPLLSDPELQEPLSDDYGFVRREEVFTVNENIHYKAQTTVKEEAGKMLEEQMEKDEEQEEVTQIFLNWDPETRMLKIPLSHFDLEDTDETEVEPEPQVDINRLLCHPVLTSVVVRQMSQDLSEEDVFTKIEKDWGLQIQSNA